MNVLFLSNWERTETWIATAQVLEARGHRCFFAVTRHHYVQKIRAAGFGDDRILWMTREKARAANITATTSELIQFEKSCSVLVRDMILKDRFLRTERQDWAMRYAAYVYAELSNFIATREIEMGVGQPDNIPDLLAIAILKRRGGRYAAPFEMRLPTKRFVLWDGDVEDRPHITGATTPDAVTPDEMEMATKLRDRVIGGVRMRQVATIAAGKVRPFAILRQLLRGFLYRALIVSRHDVYMYTLRSALFDLRYHRTPINRLMLTLTRRWLFDMPVPTERFVFYALNYAPEHTLDVEAPHYTNTYETVRAIARSLPLGVALYVKEHPVGVGLRGPVALARLRRLPGVRLIAPEHDSHALIKSAELTVSLSGTVSLEAALYGRQTAIVSDIFIQHFSTCRRLGAPWEVGAALAAPALPHDPDADLRYLAWLISNSHVGTVIEPMTDPTSLWPENVARIADGLERAISAAG